MTGMRLWTDDVSSLASVVMMLNDCSHSPVGSFHASYKPANARGPSSRNLNAKGCFVFASSLLSSRGAALPPLTPLRTVRESFQLTRLKPS
jgi:hypothetical protein